MAPRVLSWPALALGLLASGALGGASCASPSSPLAAGTLVPLPPGADAADDEAAPEAAAPAEGGDEQPFIQISDGGLDGPDPSGDDAADAADVAPGLFTDPDGPPELRLMNGAADNLAVRFCLVPWQGGAPCGPPVMPQPAAGVGALFGESFTAALPAGFDPAKDELRPIVIAGDTAASAGMNCSALLASPPASVKVSPLPVLPPGTTAAKRSQLLVAAGCLGPVAAPDGGIKGWIPESDVSVVCGQSVDPMVGNATLVLVELSRVAPPSDQIGLQLVHASTAMPALAAQVLPPGQQQPVALTGNLSLGQVAPRPPSSFSPQQLIGPSAAQTVVALAAAQSGQPLGQYVVASSLAAGLTEGDLTGGRGFVLVVLGARPDPGFDASVSESAARVVWLAAPTLSPSP